MAPKGQKIIKLIERLRDFNIKFPKISHSITSPGFNKIFYQIDPEFHSHIIQELQEKYSDCFILNIRDLVSPYIGDFEKNLVSVFNKTNNHLLTVIIGLDLLSHATEDQMLNSGLKQLLNILDGMGNVPGRSCFSVFISSLPARNYCSALIRPGRIDWVEVGP